jgi:SAM-dependent methyltransferase
LKRYNTSAAVRKKYSGDDEMDWKKYYTELPDKFEETEFLKQVGKTISGQPITQAQFSAQLADINNALNISRNDIVLDMCCGNGIITAQISKACESVAGVDFSEPLISIAKRYNSPNNVKYYCMSALDPEIKNISIKPFTKIYMYEALQHFEEGDLQKLLVLIREMAASDAIIFFGGIPDNDRIWNFYDTEERRQDYWKRKNENREAIGTWWKRDYIADICRLCRFDSVFLDQNPVLYSAHYRFDVQLKIQA